MSKNKLSMIITDYQTIPQTIKYIKKSIPVFDYPLDIVIVDNSLGFNSKSYFDKNFDFIESKLILGFRCFLYKENKINIVLIYSTENGGYAGGNNIGTKIANKLFCPKYLLFSNSDIELNNNTSIKRNIDFLDAHPSIGILGPTIQMKNGSNQNPRKHMSAKSQLIYWNFDLMWFHMRFNQWNLDRDADSKLTCWVSGSFMFVNNMAFQQCRGFDEHNFLYGEEIILSARMRNKGFKTYYLKQEPIIHAHRGGLHSTFKSRLQNHKSMKYYYQAYENTSNKLLFISDISFYIVEGVSYLKHLLFK